MLNTPTERLLPVAAVSELTSLSRTTIYERAKAGEFPKPIRISANRVAWPSSFVENWIAERVAAA